ncbi:unnamed protein product [Caenorhabditis sp. 36 PRJEB53466]|nr:unnamed protein product [Caenorhabditis sp. 36 PRJEB53466]
MFSSTPIELIPAGVLLAIIALGGIIGNTIMIIVFFKNKKLRSPCHYLITMNCVGDLLHNYGQFIYVVHLFGEFQSFQSTCFFLTIPTLFGVISGACWILGLGIDRLIACKWPIKLVTCSVPLAMGSKTFIAWSVANLGLNAVTVLIYTITYCLLLKQETDSGNGFKSVFKSIFITVAFIVVGWAVTCIANTFLVLLIPTSFGKQVLNMYSGIPVNIACAANVFIFYTVNLDYRSCIRRLLVLRSSRLSAAHSDSKPTNVPIPSVKR